MTLSLIVAGLLGGCLSGLLGLGGGAALVPCFVFLGGMSQHRAQMMSLASMLPPVGLPGLLAYRAAGVRLRWTIVGWMSLGFLSGMLLGAELANRVAGAALSLVFSAFLGALALREWWSGGKRGAPLSPLTDDEFRAPQGWATPLAIGALGGVLGGALGVGGSVIMIPLLMRFMRYARLEAQACTLALGLAPLGLPALMRYAQSHGPVPWAQVLVVAAVFAVSSRLTGRLATRLPAQVLSRGFALVLVLIASSILYRTLMPSQGIHSAP